jgi:hypothetical protein
MTVVRPIFSKDAIAHLDCLAETPGDVAVNVFEAILEILVKRLLILEQMLADAPGASVLIVCNRKPTAIRYCGD